MRNVLLWALGAACYTKKGCKWFVLVFEYTPDTINTVKFTSWVNGLLFTDIPYFLKFSS